MNWKVTVPGEQIELKVSLAFPDQELITNRSARVTHREGAGGIEGTVKNKAIGGQGYVEITGYAGKLTI